MKAEIPYGHGDSAGALGGLDGLLLVTRLPEILAQIGGDLPQPTLIAQGHGEGFSFLQMIEDLCEFRELEERRAQIEMVRVSSRSSMWT